MFSLKKRVLFWKCLVLISGGDFLFAVSLECIAGEVSFGLTGPRTRPRPQPLQQTASENVTLITTLMLFTMLLATYTGGAHTHTHTLGHMKQRIV